jgi:hypothetical protein
VGVIAENAPDPAVGHALESCIEQLLTNDAFLLTGGVHEQTITGRLVVYLQPHFPHHSVDPEYNRHGVKVKSARLFGGVKLVKPDVVVHRRNTDDHNLLVIELKVIGRGTAEDREHAYDKLSTLVHGEVFRYRYGVFVEVGLDGDGTPCVAEIRWYVREA